MKTVKSTNCTVFAIKHGTEYIIKNNRTFWGTKMEAQCVLEKLQSTYPKCYDRDEVVKLVHIIKEEAEYESDQCSRVRENY